MKKSYFSVLLAILAFTSFCLAQPEHTLHSEEANNKAGVLYFNCGNVKYYIGDYESAIEDYNEVIRLKPGYAEAYVNRGLAKANLRDYESAIADYDKAIQLKPNFAEAYVNCGNAKYHLGDSEGAVFNYNKAVGIQPDSAETYYTRCYANYHISDYEYVFIDFDTAKINLRDYNAVLEDYEEIIRFNLEDVDAYINRGKVKYYIGNYEAAIEDFDEAIRIQIDSIDSYRRYISKFDPLDDRVKEGLRDWSSLENYMAVTYVNRGIAKAELGDYVGAIEDYNKAIRLKPYLGLAYYNRGLAYEILGEKEKATADITKYEKLKGIHD